MTRISARDNTFPFSPSPQDSPSFPMPTSSPSPSSDPDPNSDSDSRLLHIPLPRRSSIPALPPYVDARPTIKTYFKIYSPSKGGRMLSIYESAPDRFNFSQSWGWKSSTLMLDEVALTGEDGEDGEERKSARGEAKLRFMVVIGNL